MLEHNKNAFSSLKLRKHFNGMSDDTKIFFIRKHEEKAFQVLVAYPALLCSRCPQGCSGGGLGGSLSQSQVFKMKGLKAVQELVCIPSSVSSLATDFAPQGGERNCRSPGALRCFVPLSAPLSMRSPCPGFLSPPLLIHPHASGLVSDVLSGDT